jgi:hypothetical protein
MVKCNLILEVNSEIKMSQFPRLPAATSAASIKSLILIRLLTFAFMHGLRCRLHITAL